MASGPSPHEAVDAHAHLHLVSPQAACDAAVAMLRANGERVTDARRAVIEVLAHTHQHVTADQVVALLESSRPVVHRATVYRTLEVLTGIGVVSRRQSAGGATAYHLAASPSGHEHLHAHCRACGAVAVLPADALSAASARLVTETGFRIEAQQSTLIGLCRDCAEAS